jgi:hypothetical protein
MYTYILEEDEGSLQCTSAYEAVNFTASRALAH